MICHDDLYSTRPTVVELKHFTSSKQGCLLTPKFGCEALFTEREQRTVFRIMPVPKAQAYYSDWSSKNHVSACMNNHHSFE